MHTLENPCEIDGFAFLEFSSQNPDIISSMFKQFQFEQTGRDPHQELEVWQQNDILFLNNKTQESQAFEHAKIHHSGPCAMGFKVNNAQVAHQVALNRGAHPAPPHPIYKCPAIQGIGGSVIYFADSSFTAIKPNWEQKSSKTFHGAGLEHIDHLTHNVKRGELKFWADFYHKIFGFKEIRDFNIQGQFTGLYSQALQSPCGKIKIPLNESKDEKSQIEEFLHDYNGEGIQHIALHTSNIYKTILALSHTGVEFLDTPRTYFQMISERLPWQQEPIKELEKLNILIDGGPNPENGILLQIFTKNILGPVFFEIIQRKGHNGFGEGNFQALFEAIERDQLNRGFLENK